MGQDLHKTLVQSLTKQYGEGRAFVMSDPKVASHVTDWVSSSCVPLDASIGRGGFPAGRITELYGLPGGGKSTIALHVLAEIQRRGGIAVLQDCEYASPLERCAAMGLNVDDLVMTQPEHLRECFEEQEFIINTVREEHPQTLLGIVMDSIAASPTEKELEGDMVQAMGERARIISLAMRRLTPLIAKERVVLIYVNQVRENIGVMYGPKDVTPGGKSLKFHASVRMRVDKMKNIDGVDKAKPVGITSRIKVDKNKVASPFREAVVSIRFDTGIDALQGFLDYCVDKGYVKVPTKGAWMEYEGKKFMRGPQFKTVLQSAPELVQKISDEVYGAKVPAWIAPFLQTPTDPEEEQEQAP